MTDSNLGLGLFILGQSDDIRRLAQLTAEPWKAANGRPAERPQTRPDFLLRAKRLFRSAPSEHARVSFTSACVDCPAE